MEKSLLFYCMLVVQFHINESCEGQNLKSRVPSLKYQPVSNAIEARLRGGGISVEKWQQKLGFERPAADLILGKTRKGGPLDRILHGEEQQQEEAEGEQIVQNGQHSESQQEGPEGARQGSETHEDDETWAAEGDVPSEYRESATTNIVLSGDMQAKLGSTGDLSSKRTVMVDGVEMDSLLFDIVQAARRGLDGTEKEISGKQVLVITRCVQDADGNVPTAAEANVLQHMLRACKLTSEAKQLLNRHLRRVAQRSKRVSPLSGREQAGTSLRQAEQVKPSEEEEGVEGRKTDRGDAASRHSRGAANAAARRRLLPGAEWVATLEEAVQRGSPAHVTSVLSEIEAASVRCLEAPRELVLGVRRLRKAEDAGVRRAARTLFEQWRAQARPDQG